MHPKIEAPIPTTPIGKVFHFFLRRPQKEFLMRRSTRGATPRALFDKTRTFTKP
jgi:hypothetical protein